MTFLYQKSRCLIEAFSLHLKHLLLFLPTTMYEGSFISTVSYGSAICSGEDILTVKDRADRDMYMFKKERKEQIASDKTKNYELPHLIRSSDVVSL